MEIDFGLDIFSPRAQEYIKKLQQHLPEIQDLLEEDCDFLITSAYCIGFLIGQGLCRENAEELVNFAYQKNFWIHSNIEWEKHYDN